MTEIELIELETKLEKYIIVTTNLYKVYITIYNYS